MEGGSDAHGGRLCQSTARSVPPRLLDAAGAERVSQSAARPTTTESGARWTTRPAPTGHRGADSGESSPPPAAPPAMPGLALGPGRRPRRPGDRATRRRRPRRPRPGRDTAGAERARGSWSSPSVVAAALVVGGLVLEAGSDEPGAGRPSAEGRLGRGRAPGSTSTAKPTVVPLGVDLSWTPRRRGRGLSGVSGRHADRHGCLDRDHLCGHRGGAGQTLHVRSRGPGVDDPQSEPASVSDRRCRSASCRRPVWWETSR